MPSPVWRSCNAGTPSLKACTSTEASGNANRSSSAQSMTPSVASAGGRRLGISKTCTHTAARAFGWRCTFTTVSPSSIGLIAAFVSIVSAKWNLSVSATWILLTSAGKKQTLARPESSEVPSKTMGLHDRTCAAPVSAVFLAKPFAWQARRLTATPPPTCGSWTGASSPAASRSMSSNSPFTGGAMQSSTQTQRFAKYGSSSAKISPTCSKLGTCGCTRVYSVLPRVVLDLSSQSNSTSSVGIASLLYGGTRIPSGMWVT
mmetsp:Transcript_63771/g.137209  ORF Transcript_63771/g.137209 Transcript_63771/m.137209 type:complete len:260 (+) Transcript_63771:281-1060(+)